MTKKGGAIIGKGAYGCVFKPAIKCKDTDPPQGHIGKVSFSDASHDHEASIGRTLSKIDRNQDYFIYPVDVRCFVARDDVMANDPHDRCGFRASPRRDTYGQLIMPYGGVTLAEYLKSLPMKLDRKSLLRILYGMLKAVKVLVDARLVHQDIKPYNIVIDEKQVTRLIDFGTMTKAHVLHNSSLLGVDYYLNGPEYRIKIYDTAEDLYKAQKKNITQWCRHTDWKADGMEAYDEAHSRSLHEYFARCKSSPSNFMNAPTADVYSLGVLIMMLNPVLVPAGLERPGIVKKFNSLVYDMLTPDPFKRITIDKVLADVDDILQTPSRTPSPVSKDDGKKLRFPRPPSKTPPVKPHPRARRVFV